MEVSVVICAYDEARWPRLQATLASVERQSHRPVEIVLVIDHSPSLFDRARRELRRLVVVENSARRGLAGARNSGVAASSGSVVAFVDDDAIASPSWLELLVERYADPAVAGVGGSIEPLWEQGRPRWFPTEFDWVVGCSYCGMPEIAQEVRNLFGCNMSFRRDLLTTVGGFRLGYSCDETELCIRLRRRWPWRKLVYLPEGKVFHHVPVERARLRYFITRCYFEGGSKAVVSALVGAGPGLSSERHYLRKTLPAAVVQGMHDFVRGRDPAGLSRTSTIFMGVTTTSLGYVAGRASTSRAARRRGLCGDGPIESYGASGAPAVWAS